MTDDIGPNSGSVQKNDNVVVELSKTEDSPSVVTANTYSDKAGLQKEDPISAEEFGDNERSFPATTDEIEPNPATPQNPPHVIVDLSEGKAGTEKSAPQRLIIEDIEEDVRRRQKRNSAPFQVCGTYFGVDDGNYQGYKLVSPRDLESGNAFSTRSTKFNVDKIDPDMLRDSPKSSKTLMIFISVLTLAFVTSLIWQVLIGKCLVTELCEANDRSADLSAAYLFKTFDFRVPTSFVWTNLVGGTLGMLLASILAFAVLRRTVGSAKMVQASTMVRKGSILFLGQQSIAFLIPFILFFILFGLKLNWETAGSFGIGALLGITTDFIARGIGSRGSVRAAAASHSGFDRAIRLAFRVAVIGVLQQVQRRVHCFCDCLGVFS
ncbi:pyrophosphatase [Gracilaria domingensis]|nr:pyrophosphatase [Gracilaria domingensis]